MKRWKLVLAIVCALVLVIIVGAVAATMWVLRGSLPHTSGTRRVAGLSHTVEIARDAQGIPTIRAKNRVDLAFATGFVHGQERFFQMDLLRRNSAGELAELIGTAVLDHDRDVRRLRFRARAQQVVQRAPKNQAELLVAYAEGVNTGLASLSARPFEYFALGSEPAPWKPEDSALVLYAMYLDLQGEGDIRFESQLGLMYELLPSALADFLAPRGTEWDAPIVGADFDQPPVPGPEVLDLRAVSNQAGCAAAVDPRGLVRAIGPMGDGFRVGSNNWAVSGKHTKHGGAIVADDMHLDIRVPNIWYRASLVWPEDAPDDESDQKPVANAEPALQQITGVTLPGTPAIVVGSNQHVAWAFTNSEGDWLDVIILEPDPANPKQYLTPDGPKAFEKFSETIHVQGAADETIEIEETIWGPVISPDHQGQKRAIHWVALEQEGVNMGVLELEGARTLEEAMDRANLSGSPAQNFTVGDEDGRIAWTILGRIPRRKGFDGRLPTSWADGTRGWDGWLAPDEYPRVVDPESGRIWTANARVVSDEMLAIVGDGDYDLGARQQQIRDDLLEMDQVEEADMLKVQMDDRAILLTRWRDLMLELLTPEAISDHPLRKEARKFLDDWGGRASVDSVGFYLARSFRLYVIPNVIAPLTAKCREVDPKFDLTRMDRIEGPAWALVSQKPLHLLSPEFESWEAMLLAAIDVVLEEATADGKALAANTWGAHHISQIQHPLSLAVPDLGRWLDMPREPLPGDSANMPRIQRVDGGASERMAVSPGRESAGYLHMPCGQSGHFLSPNYGDQHAAWVKGEVSPFLPGEVVNTLVLEPAG